MSDYSNEQLQHDLGVYEVMHDRLLVELMRLEDEHPELAATLQRDEQDVGRLMTADTRTISPLPWHIEVDRKKNWPLICGANGELVATAETMVDAEIIVATINEHHRRRNSKDDSDACSKCGALRQEPTR